MTNFRGHHLFHFRVFGPRSCLLNNSMDQIRKTVVHSISNKSACGAQHEGANAKNWKLAYTSFANNKCFASTKHLVNTTHFPGLLHCSITRPKEHSPPQIFKLNLAEIQGQEHACGEKNETFEPAMLAEILVGLFSRNWVRKSDNYSYFVFP